VTHQVLVKLGSMQLMQKKKKKKRKNSNFMFHQRCKKVGIQTTINSNFLLNSMSDKPKKKGE
jgi:hypothetical protein